MGVALPAVNLGTGRTAVEVAAGSGHTCARLDDGSTKCWGENTFGQLGLGDTERRGEEPDEMGDDLPPVDLGPGRSAVRLAAGYWHTCALLDNGAVKCWGRSNHGQLGLGDMETRGDDPAEMGAALHAVDLGGRAAVDLTASYTHACALLDNGAVKCWGDNEFGQLGLGDTASRGDGPGEMGDMLPPVDLGSGRSAIGLAAGPQWTCARLDSLTLKCWGSNFSGQLGLGDTANRGDEPGEMGDSLLPVDFGSGRTVTAVAVGDWHACAILDQGTVKCWGSSVYGQVGQGDHERYGDEPGEMGDLLAEVDLGTGQKAVGLTAGSQHSCVLLENHAVKCWGWNLSGQLGLEDAIDRGDDPGEMGNSLATLNLGDVNLDATCDGWVDVRDVLQVRRIVAGLDVPMATCSHQFADADNSGLVDANDALLILRSLAGLE
jgi:E3 ubiquitin-protein ligase HERC3